MRTPTLALMAAIFCASCQEEAARADLDGNAEAFLCIPRDNAGMGKNITVNYESASILVEDSVDHEAERNALVSASYVRWFEASSNDSGQYITKWSLDTYAGHLYKGTVTCENCSEAIESNGSAEDLNEVYSGIANFFSGYEPPIMNCWPVETWRQMQASR